MDALRFAKACEEAEQASPSDKGIGTLSEKTLHAVLKRYYEPYGDNHEVKIGGYVADIVGEHGIIEIQTRNFDRLRKKLEEIGAHHLIQTKRGQGYYIESGETI